MVTLPVHILHVVWQTLHAAVHILHVVWQTLHAACAHPACGVANTPCCLCTSCMWCGKHFMLPCTSCMWCGKHFMLPCTCCMWCGKHFMLPVHILHVVWQTRHAAMHILHVVWQTFYEAITVSVEAHLGRGWGHSYASLEYVTIIAHFKVFLIGWKGK